MKCSYANNATICQANSMKGCQFCFYHNPDISDQEKKQAQIKGGKGKNGKIKRVMPKMSIKTTQAVVVLIEDTINAVRGGQMDVRIANCLGFLSGHLIKALEASDITKRLELIEETISNFKHGHN